MVAFPAWRETLTMSLTPRRDTSPAVLISTSQLLATPGRAKRINCGNWMRRKARSQGMPMARAASIWPRGTAR